MIDVTAIHITELPYVTPDALPTLPAISALYFVLNANNDVLYVGQSRNLRQRWYMGHGRIQQFREAAFQRIHWLPLDIEDLVFTESEAIAYFAPSINVRYSNPRHPDILQQQLETIYEKFYGNLDGIYLPRV